MEASTSTLITLLSTKTAESAFLHYGLPGLILFTCALLLINHKKITDLIALFRGKPTLEVYALPQAKDRTNDDCTSVIPLDFPSTTQLELCIYNPHKTISAANVNIDIQNLSRPTMKTERIGDVGKIMNRRVNGFTLKMNYPLPPRSRVPFAKISFAIPDPGFREKTLELVYSIFGDNTKIMEKKKLKNTLRVFHTPHD